MSCRWCCQGLTYQFPVLPYMESHSPPENLILHTKRDLGRPSHSSAVWSCGNERIWSLPWLQTMFSLSATVVSVQERAHSAHSKYFGESSPLRQSILLSSFSVLDLLSSCGPTQVSLSKVWQFRIVQFDTDNGGLATRCLCAHNQHKHCGQ